MKEINRKTIVVTEYTTDFGSRFTDKDLCRECENQEYINTYNSLYNSANETQRMLLDAIVKELSEHLSSAYCEQSISNDALYNLIESLHLR